MYLNQIEIFNFRNLKTQLVEFPEQVTLVIGNNGQGKTSLLEAIYILSQGKSFRSNKQAEILNWQAENEKCLIEGFVNSLSGTNKINYILENGRRKILLNDKTVGKASNFYGQFTAVEFTPQELQLVSGAPIIRRQFIDKTMAMVDKLYVDSLVKYQRALKQRNSLLKSYPPAPESEIDIWDKTLIEQGLIIAEKRLLFLEGIEQKFHEYYQNLAQNKHEKAYLKIESNFISANRLLEQQELEKIFSDSRAVDLQQQKTNIGVHRDELIFLLDVGSGQKSARSFASQGQTRCLALAINLASIDFLLEKTGEEPLVLLDDVESELDINRTHALYQLLWQAFLPSNYYCN